MVKLQSLFVRMASSLIDRALKKHLSSFGVVLVLAHLSHGGPADKAGDSAGADWSQRSALHGGSVSSGSVSPERILGGG